MSGIVAVYCLDGRPAERGLVSAMLDAAAYRGPDGLNSWIDGPVGLGHAMLRTTPEAVGESQPLIDEQAGLALTMDGRVDNRDELKELLERKGLRPVGNTDAEIVLRAYQCWGEEAAAKILGDFAFALWDGRKHQMFCARDFASVQPLFYYCDGRSFICASEPQQILAEPSVPRAPNETVIGVFLSGILMNPAATVYRDIRKLEGGCSIDGGTGQDRSAPFFRHRPGKKNPLSHRRGIRRAFRVAVPGGGAMPAAQYRRGGGRTQWRAGFLDWSSGPPNASSAKGVYRLFRDSKPFR